MRRSLKISSIGASVIAQILLFLFAAFVIFLASYILGYHYLLGNTLTGNDSYSFFTIADWINKFFPSVPFWFPLQGGGVSFTGYPWFSAYVVNIISHFTPLSLIQAFRLYGFLSVPLTGIGIFVFVWTRLTEVKPVWLRQALGIIASLFYVVAPISWLWLTQWGFYAEQTSLIFVPWIFLFFDLYLEKVFQNKYDFIFRLSLVAGIIFWILGFLTHFYIAIVGAGMFIILAITKFIFSRENKIQLVKRVILPTSVFFVIFLGVILFRYYPYTNYMAQVAKGGYTGYANLNNNKTQTAGSLLTPKIMLSLENPSPKSTDWRIVVNDMRFPFYVWLLLLPTILLGALKSKKVFVFGILALIGFIANTNVDAFIFFNQMPLISSIPILNQLPLFFTSRIFFIGARIYVPVAAAFGAYVLWEILFSYLANILRKINIHDYLVYSFKALVVLILTLSTACFLVYKFYNLPYPRYIANVGSYNSTVIDSQGNPHQIKLDIRDIWGESIRPDAIYTSNYSPHEASFLNSNLDYFNSADYIYLNYLCVYGSPQSLNNYIYPSGSICDYYKNRQANPNLKISIFPPIEIVKNAQAYCNNLSLKYYNGKNKYCLALYKPSFLDQLALKNWPKFQVSSDISQEINSLEKFFSPLPKNTTYRYDISGYSAQTVTSAALYNPNSEIQVYINTLSLLYNAWNYQAQVMYSIYPPNQQPGVLTQLGKWFGLNYVYLAGSNLEPFGYWQQDKNWTGTASMAAGWKTFKESTGITTWDDRPRILVISDNKKGTLYDGVFEAFTKGALNYSQGIPVEGKNAVDSYTLEQLEQYSTIYMEGYDYNSQSNAYNLLDQYVKNGGNLIFDTGWQYNIPDYQLKNTPSFMPFDSLSWRNLSTRGSFKIEDQSIAPDINVSRFGPLTYNGTSWGVSVPGGLRSWGKTVLSYDGNPLVVAGQYGKGKVVWIGFNLMAHAQDKESTEELTFFNRLTGYVDKANNYSQYNISANMQNPDRVEFTLNQTVNTNSDIYYREAYYPDWNAKLITANGAQSIPILRSGPGFMLMIVPPVEAGDKILISINKSVIEYLADIISIIAFLSVLIYLFYPKILKVFIGFFLKISGRVNKFEVKLPKISASITSEEEDY